MYLVISILFTLLHLAAAFFLALLSVHGPGVLPQFALIWLIIMQVTLWSGFVMLRKSQHGKSAVYLIILGVITLATAPLAFLVAEKFEAYHQPNTVQSPAHVRYLS